jgi:predicted RNA methylase
MYHAWYDSPLGAACLGSEIHLLGGAAGEIAGKTVIEIGCGTGRLRLGLARAAHIAVGIDRDRSMLQIARQKGTLHALERCVWVETDPIPFRLQTIYLTWSWKTLSFAPALIPHRSS